jgi:hypothetical protein
MWRFQLFVIFRMPISFACLPSYIKALYLSGSNEWFTALVVIGLAVFMGYASIQLQLFRAGALRLGGVLLTLEVVGFILQKMVGDFTRRGAFDPAHAFKMLGVALVVWALPNGLVLYSQRARFTGPAKATPGL